jgi:DNA-binding PadR family transcriptional regulator
MSRLYRRVIWRKVTEADVLRALKILMKHKLVKVGEDAVRGTVEDVYTLTQSGIQCLGEMERKKK